MIIYKVTNIINGMIYVGVTVEAIRMALDKKNRKSAGFKWETII